MPTLAGKAPGEVDWNRGPLVVHAPDGQKRTWDHRGQVPQPRVSDRSEAYI